MTELVSRRQKVEFEGSIDGERRRLRVTLSSLLSGMGMVSFEGSEDPY